MWRRRRTGRSLDGKGKYKNNIIASCRIEIIFILYKYK
jgi:hypothetical protein